MVFACFIVLTASVIFFGYVREHTPIVALVMPLPNILLASSSIRTSVDLVGSY